MYEDNVKVEKWYENLTYEGLKRFIQENLNSMAREFVAIGYYLKYARDHESYLEGGYENIWEFAEGEFGIKRPTCSRWMAINDRFSEEGNSPILEKKYWNYSRSQLQEMLYLEDTQLDQVSSDMTVKEIRKIRHPEGCATSHIEPPVVPSDEKQAEPEVIEPQNYEIGKNDDDFCEKATKNDIKMSEHIFMPEPVADVEYEEIESVPAEENSDEHESEEANQSDRITDKDILRSELETQKRQLELALKLDLPEDDYEVRKLKLVVGALAGMMCDIEADEDIPQKPEQPLLPILKNNEQRKAFIEGYASWPIWIDNQETGERYYRYDLPDGRSFVVKVYYYTVFDFAVEAERWEDRYRPGWGGEEYYRLKEGKFFKDCLVNKSTLIDTLKEIQKGDK